MIGSTALPPGADRQQSRYPGGHDGAGARRRESENLRRCRSSWRKWRGGRAGGRQLQPAGGNVTGVTLMSPRSVGLRLALLREAAPAAKRDRRALQPGRAPTEKELRETEVAAQTLGVTLLPVEASNVDALNQAFSSAVAGGADTLLTFPHVFAFFHRHESPSLRPSTACPRCTAGASMPQPAASWPMARTSRQCSAARPSFVDRIIKGPIQPTCQSSSRPNSNWSSTSRPPRRSASKFHRRCSPAPTR